MNLRQFLNPFRQQHNTAPGTLQTPYGTLQLAKDADPKKVQSILSVIQQTTDALTRKDIADWRRAWQLAISVEHPSRRLLYDIYRDVEVDAHLSGCVHQRQGFVLAKSYKLTQADGTPDEDALHYLDQTWFKQLCRLILDSTLWGHSLVELGNVVTDADGCPTYDAVTLIPRKHVIPEHHRFVTTEGLDWQSGIDYRQPPFTENLIEAGRPNDLGLYLKAAQHTIPKKNMLAFWDTFGEIFGMPMRIARTATRDKTELTRLAAMLRDMGFSQSAVMPLDTEIQLVESTRGDAYNVYNQRIDRANSELSKLIIGQTMTIEDGSSLSQSQTHLQVFQNLVEEDADMLRDVINNQLLPRMIRHGFPLDGLRFDWDYSVDYTPEQQVAYETMIADRYEVDPQYFADKYSMPVGERRASALIDYGTTNEQDNEEEQPDDDEKGENDEKDADQAADETPTDNEKDENEDENNENEDADNEEKKRPKKQKNAHPFLNKNGCASAVSSELDSTRIARFFD